MKLEELHILQRDAAAIDHGHAVASEGVRVGADAEHLAAAARSEQNGLGMKSVNLPCGQAERHNSGTSSLLNQQVKHVVFIVKVHVVLDALLVAGLKNHVAGAVRGIAGTAHGSFAEIARVAAEGPLGDLPVGRAAKGQAPMLEIVYGFDGLAAEDLHGVLVSQIVAALDGVEHVPFPMVLFQISQCSANSTLRRSGVRARRIELAQHRHVALPGKLQRGHQPRSSCPHHYRVIPLDHMITPRKKLSVLSFQ